ncbi:ferritin [Selenomonadales bacterium OttesenSCG-928-I06]|nr:ferritin [Selenomonadales bacterium OttesenSCG-928-I06]
MLKIGILKALSDQVTAEYYSAYLYMSMSAYCDQAGFKGFANWLYVQAQEEIAHGTHIFEHILDRGEMPQLGQVNAPPLDFAGPLEVFTKALKHEEYVTSLINKIASLARDENDHATYNFIQWYIEEQVEEEATASLIVQKIKFIGENSAMLYTLDTEMAARTFTDPFANTNTDAADA